MELLSTIFGSDINSILSHEKRSLGISLYEMRLSMSEKNFKLCRLIFVRKVTDGMCISAPINRVRDVILCGQNNYVGKN